MWLKDCQFHAHLKVPLDGTCYRSMTKRAYRAHFTIKVDNTSGRTMRHDPSETTSNMYAFGDEVKHHTSAPTKLPYDVSETFGKYAKYRADTRRQRSRYAFALVGDDINHRTCAPTPPFVNYHVFLNYAKHPCMSETMLYIKHTTPPTWNRPSIRIPQHTCYGIL